MRARAAHDRRWRLLALAVPLALLLGALAATTVLAQGSTTEEQSTQTEPQANSAERQALEAVRAQSVTEEPKWKGSKKNPYPGGEEVFVATTCSEVKVRYLGFKPGTAIFQTLQIKQEGHLPLSKKLGKGPLVIGSEGKAEETYKIGTPKGHYQIDVFGNWESEGGKQDFDLTTPVECEKNSPGFFVYKEQKLAGSPGNPTPAKIEHAKVGETVEYTIVVTNDGYLPLKHVEVSDALCDPNTLKGGPPPPEMELKPLETTEYTCTRLLTESGTFTNVATVKGTAEEEGKTETIEQESFEVIVEVEKPKEKEKEKENGGNNGNTTSGSGNSSDGTTTTTTTPAIAPAALIPQQGISPFKAATPPSLLGPQGCVRGSSFTAKLKSKNVASVIFYLDGHRVGRYTARAARHGYLTIRINTSKLKIGRHKLVAKIVMTTATSASVKPVHATRSLTFVHCASAAVKPKFTG